MTTYDYAIVGAGLIGSACAKYVSQSLSDEKSVCLIGPDPPSAAERQAGSTRIAFGADDDEGRIVTCDTISDPLGAALARKTIARFGQIQASTGVQFFSEVRTFTSMGFFNRPCGPCGILLCLAAGRFDNTISHVIFLINSSGSSMEQFAGLSYRLSVQN
eukprot:scpid91060/ scgid3872/ 